MAVDKPAVDAVRSSRMVSVLEPVDGVFERVLDIVDGRGAIENMVDEAGQCGRTGRSANQLAMFIE